jgi:hypothetical protein
MEVSHALCDLENYDLLKAFTFKWTRLLNELLLKIIRFWWYLQCYHMLKVVTEKKTQLLNELLLKTNRFWCQRQNCHMPNDFILK